jgi:hypothetical protein
MSTGINRFIEATRRVSNQICFTDKDQRALAASLAVLNMYKRGELSHSFTAFDGGISSVQRKLVDVGCYDVVHDTLGRQVGVSLTEDAGIFYAVMSVAGGYCPPHLAANPENLADPRTGKPILPGGATVVADSLVDKKVPRKPPTKPTKVSQPKAKPATTRKSKPRRVAQPQSPHVRSYLWLSASHVPSEYPNFGTVMYQETPVSWIVWPPTSNTRRVPSWLKPIFAYAKKHNCDFIEFAETADECTELHVY